MEDDASLIEDYFKVNTDPISIVGTAGASILVEPFCVEGPGVFDFSLSASILDQFNGIVV